MSQPVQLRLGFTSPVAPCTMRLSLAGGQVSVVVDHDQLSRAWAYLASVGIAAEASGATLVFAASALPALALLPGQVVTVPAENLATLHALIMSPSAQGRPAELTISAGGQLWMSWDDGACEHSELFPTSAAVALFTTELAFVATVEAFAVVRAACTLPVLVGRAKVNLDGFIEISTPRPQMLESAPLPGLFRIDDTHYGLALAAATAVDQASGVIWEGPRPILEMGPAQLPPMPMPLSMHASADLRTLVDALAAYRAQAVVWDSGLGRRIFALAAIEALDAWPLLIVCLPAQVYPWQRHLGMFGKSCSLSHSDADAHIVTYAELASSHTIATPQAVIFDEPAHPSASDPFTRAALRRLDALADTYRIAVAASWPTSLDALPDVMSVLRPGEFRPDLPWPGRYPPNAAERMREHVELYMSRRTSATDGNDDTAYRRATVRLLDPSEAQRVALSGAARRHRDDPDTYFVEACEILSSGPAHALSPKVPAAIAKAQSALAAGRRVIIATRHRSTATLIKSVLRTTDAVIIEAQEAIARGVPPARLVIVRFDRELPDLSGCDDLIVVDYPWSTALLERATGSASDIDGPLSITVLHLQGTLDDGLAMYAAHRAERGPVTDQSAAPSPRDLADMVARDPCHI